MADFWLPTWKSTLLGLRCCSWGLLERWKHWLHGICIERAVLLRASRLSNPSNQGSPQTTHEAAPPTQFAVWASNNLIKIVFKDILWTCLKHHYLLYSSHLCMPMDATFPIPSSPNGSSDRGQADVGLPMVTQMAFKVPLCSKSRPYSCKYHSKNAQSQL